MCLFVGLEWYGIVIRRTKAAGRHPIQEGANAPGGRRPTKVIGCTDSKDEFINEGRR